jgi:hypothetical protein
MPKNRPSGIKPLLGKSSGDLKVRLSARRSRPKSAASTKNKKKPARADIVQLHYNETPSYLNRPIPWWTAPDTRGLLHPGGPGHTPPPPPPHSHPGGPGHFPPPPPPHPHPPGPFPPGSAPFPVPIPVPIPIPGPQPFPIPVPIPGPQPIPGPSFITVTIIGGLSFQGINYTNFIPYYPGITIRQALASTGIVGFGPFGFIASVAGIPVGGGVNVRLRYNGRVIPQTLLSFPADPGSAIGIELYYALTDAVPIPL